MQHHGAALRAIDGDDGFARALALRGAEAADDRRLRAMLAYAEKLTLRPGAVEEADVERLRDVGLTDEAVLHLAEVVAYYNYVNRTADGLGVSLEEDWPHPILPLDPEEDGPGAG